ncbi:MULTISPECIES: asparagine--tRNA ligase [Flectobacillus]|jgi:asparaginyl-tRNA synthetase|uniref:Asparagine--tRNA ligase n=1 Tax=Flectobacillus roseus TaxID=502259 RepID=A0ABT6Y5Q1_9BACT|nr:MULTISPECIES: asparagine--tRNA ligase [Flectobacillus]MDI9858867.1 asparagine--tRNA ligase [Flectobacillus roseus]NBA76539.1 asparagine--tRNA ligase [Emticicia sp. ODNR4P]PAC27950.1 asparagine--tRNA ligase [Flectobacillus sp. BAB-3569]
MQIKQILAEAAVGSEITVKGWVRTKRESKNVTFININDGSVIHNIQAVAEAGVLNEETQKLITTGACVAITGTLIESQGSGQKVELQVKSALVYGTADPEKYPLQPKKHSLEFLREIGHLRPRTNTFSAILRVRHTLAYAIHKYFNDNGFFYLHTPIITGSDAEGAGEMFRVTTLDPKNPPLNEDGSVNYKEDFFGRETNLTVSGQLEGELGAMALSKVYTFGPTFRAENSNTARHLAEFWMIEPEVAFYELEDNMALAEDFTKYVIKYALDNCYDDLVFLEGRLKEEEKNKKQEERSELALIEKLKFVIDNDYVKLTYTEAIQILLSSKRHKEGKFQYPVAWGIDLQSEHERYLVEKHFKKPVILTNYPKDIKAFYMKLDEVTDNVPGQTVRAMDVLFPGIGEIIGGSQREDNYEKLAQRCQEVGIPIESIWWYLETRQFGTAPHAGFGIGFERLVMFVTGMTNIRDVIPFPRTPKTAEF